jgi:hypothetical protein
MNLTCVRQMAVVCAARATPSAAGCIDVKIGTAMAQAITSPVSIAIPTDNPTKWPAPTSASDQAMLYPVDAAAPSRMKPVMSAAAMRVAVTIASPAEATDPRITATSPSLASPDVFPCVPISLERTRADTLKERLSLLWAVSSDANTDTLSYLLLKPLGDQPD